jgi:hypothetical protein
VIIRLAYSIIASDIVLCEPPILAEIRYCRNIVIHIEEGMATSSLEGRDD